MKSILITGCSTGVGYYCANNLLKEGYRVIATARYKKDLNRLKDEGFDSYQIDLRYTKSINQALDKILDKYNKIDILFNNAGYAQVGALEDLSKEALIEQFNTNVFGTHELTKLIIPIMRKQGFGKIIYNSSLLSFLPLKYLGAYSASKQALEALADTLRLELSGSGIDIICIQAGLIQSEFRQNAIKMFYKYVDKKNSLHLKAYEKKFVSLNYNKDNIFKKFILKPDDIYIELLKAINNPRPSLKYKVGLSTKLFWYLKKILTIRALDKILVKI